jgi:hypothetical protein
MITKKKLLSLVFFFIFFSLIIYLISFNIDQRAINAGLYLSKKLEIVDKNNLLNLEYSNSYTLIYQFSEIALRIGASPSFLNFLLLFFSFILNSLGIFFIVRSITRNFFFSLITTAFAIVTLLNFGDLDYPVLVFSEHTNGMIASSLIVFIFGLVGNKNYKLALLFCLICLASHLVLGIWIFIITTVTFYFYNKDFLIFFLKNKKNILIFLFIIFFLLLSIFYFQFSKILINYKFNGELFNVYLSVWEHHRDLKAPINIIYILLSFALFFIILFFINFNERNLSLHTVIMLKLLLIHLFCSFIIYILYKFFPNLFSFNFARAMPSRFFLLHSFFGLYVLISILYMLIIKKKKLLFFFLIILCVSTYFNLGKSVILKYINSNLILNEDNSDVEFWKLLKNSRKKGMVFKPSFKYFKNEKINFIPEFLKLETLLFQNMFILSHHILY